MNDNQADAILRTFESLTNLVTKQQHEIDVLKQQVKELASQCNAREIMIEIEKTLWHTTKR